MMKGRFGLFHRMRALKLPFLVMLVVLALSVAAAGCNAPASTNQPDEPADQGSASQESTTSTSGTPAEDGADGAGDADRPLPSPGALPGLTEATGGWLPESRFVIERDKALSFPPLGDESFHIHALLTIYVDGKKMPVPNNIGVSNNQPFISSLHTHDASGVVHFEADDPFAFRLGDVFAVWGVVFTEDQVGGYKAAGDKTLKVYVNGKEIESAPSYEIKAKDNIVVAFGATDDFDKEPSTEALESQE